MPSNGVQRKTTNLLPPAEQPYFNEPIQSIFRRRLIIAGFWIGVLCGIPYWWYTTRIERLTLPTAEIETWLSKKAVYNEENVFTSKHLSDNILDPQFVPSELTNLPRLESDHRIVKYAANYKIVMSLLNEDAGQGRFVLNWNVNELIETWIAPLLTSLEPISSFDIETEVQYFAPLSVPIDQSESGSFVVEADDLKAFVNPADWRMPSASFSSPVLHFMVFVPSPAHHPLLVRDIDGSNETSNAFLIPQRGGVVIFNVPPLSVDDPEAKNGVEISEQDFSTPFRLMQQQLRQLLGVPSGVSAYEGALEQWQIDIIVRARLLQAMSETIETLKAIVDLVRDIPNMRVGKEVQIGVKMALANLSKAAEMQSDSPEEALRHAAIALDLSSKAYFNPSMLALLYFPDEHKYAVYTPLFGPVAVPLLVALIKELKDWRTRKRKRKDVTNTKLKIQ